MTSFLLDLDSDFSELKNSIGETREGISFFGKALNEVDTAGNTLKKTLNGLGKAGLGLFNALGSIGEIGLKLGTTVAVANAAKKAFYDWQNIANNLDFATAVSGTQELATSFKAVDVSSSLFFKTASRGFTDLAIAATAAGSVILDSQNFKELSVEATKAFSQVEDSAYRTSTVIVGVGESSISALGKTIKTMRELQKATDFSVSSTEALNAQYDIASAGFAKTADTLSVGTAAINLNNAGYGQLTDTTGALVKVLNALGDTGAEADKRAAQLFTTTKVGLTTIPELSSEIGSLASLGKQLGLEFSDVSAALALLTTQGINTAEASTVLTNFLLDVSSNSDQAKAALAGFQDAAGNPIQLNAQSLKDNGIKGIIDQLGQATKGNVASLQKVFSNQSSLTASQLLIGAGTDNLDSFKEKIENADPGQLAQESANKAKILQGAFTQAANKSKKSLEEIGQGLSTEVLAKLVSLNDITESVASGTAENFGKVAGTIEGLGAKIKAVGNFIGTAFSAVAPIALFGVITQKIGGVIGKISQVISAIKTGRKEGETWFDYLYRSGVSALAKLKVAFDKFIGDVRTQINLLGVEIEKTADVSPDKPKATTGAVNTGASTNKKTSPISSSALALPDISPSAITLQKNSSKIGETAKTIAQRFNGATAAVGTFAKQGVGLLSNVLTTSITYLGGMAIGLAAVTAAITIGAGWLETFSVLADTRTLPAVQEMRDRLLDLSNIDSIRQLTAELDITASTLENTNLYAEAFSQAGSFIAGAWNEATGAATRYRASLEFVREAQSLLAVEASKAISAANQGDIVVRNDSQRVAQEKIKLGIVLDSNDEAAIKESINDSIKIFQAKITEQKKLIENTQSSGGFFKESRVEELKNELQLLEQQAEAESKKLELSKQSILTASKLKEISSFDVTVPLQVQLNTQSLNQTKTQLKNLADSFSNVFSKENIDPQAFNDLVPKLQSTLDTIKLQTNIDPLQAAESFRELQNIPGLDKLIFSDANVRNLINDFQQQLSSAITEQQQQISKTKIKPLETATSLGNTSPDLNLAKNNIELASINLQAKTLTEEYNNQATSVQRQVELASQLSDLEARRAEIAAQNKIDTELGSKKQLLTLQEKLLEIEQQRLGLFSRGDGNTSVVAAQATLDAAEKELEVKQQSIALETRELEIKQQASIETIKDRKTNIQNNSFNAAASSNPTSEGISIKAIDGQTNTLISNDNTNFDSLISTIEKTSDSQIKAIKEAAEKNKKEAETTFDKKSQDSLINALENNKIAREQLGIKSNKTEDIRKELFSGDTLKIDANELANVLTSTANKANVGIGRQIADATSAAAASTLTGGLAEVGINDAARERSQREASAAQIKTANSIRDKLLDTANRNKKIDTDSEGKIDQVNAQRERAKQSVETSRQNILKNNQDKQVELSQLDAALAGAVDSANLSNVLGELSNRFNSFPEVLKRNQAAIENEFAKRQLLIEQNEQLFQSFEGLQGTLGGLLENKSSGNAVRQFSNTLNPEVSRINLEADKKLANLQGQVKTSRDELKSALAVRDNAVKAGAEPSVIKELTQQVNKFSQRADATSKEVTDKSIFINAKREADVFAANLAINIQIQQAEIDARERNIDKLNELSQGFSTVASSASNIFTNSNVGASIEALASSLKQPISQAFETASIEQSKIENRRSAGLNAVKAADFQISQARRNGASNKQIDELIKARNNIQTTVDKDFASDSERNKQTLILNALNAGMEELASQINETVGFMQKFSSVTKDRIAFELQKQQNNLEFNDSTRGLSSAILGFFGPNNPFAQAIQQRQDVTAINEKSEFEKASAISDTRQQLIDLTVLDAQLALEQKGYDNALTQTQLLSDIVSVSSGGKAVFSGTGGQVDTFLSKLPSLFADNQKLTSLRQGLVNEQLKELPKQLQDKLSNIDANNASQRLNTLSSNLNPANVDLIMQSFTDANNLRNSRESRPIDSLGGISNDMFSKQIETLTSKNQGLQSQDLSLQIKNQLASISQNSAPNRTTQQATTVINATIPITLTAPQSSNQSEADFTSSVRSITSKAVNEGLNRLSKEVLSMSKR